MINIDGSLFIQIANFLILIIALNYLLYRPLRAVLQQRREKFMGYETDIHDLADRADGRIQEIEARLAEARHDGFNKKDELKGSGLDEEKRILAQASTEADIKIQEVKDQIKNEIALARGALQSEVEGFSMEVAQKILGRSLS